MNNRRALKGSLIGLGLLAVAAPALATHNSFVMVDGPQYCEDSGTTEANIDYAKGSNTNFSHSIYMSCAVNLGGQFKGQNPGTNFDPPQPSFPIVLHATVPSVNAKVYVMDGSATESVQCTAWATTATNSAFFSATKQTTNSYVGPQTLDVASPGGWGGILGTGTANVAIRSLLYECAVPRANFAGWSGVLGYRTRICANNTICN